MTVTSTAPLLEARNLEVVYSDVILVLRGVSLNGLVEHRRETA